MDDAKGMEQLVHDYINRKLRAEKYGQHIPLRGLYGGKRCVQPADLKKDPVTGKRRYCEKYDYALPKKIRVAKKKKAKVVKVKVPKAKRVKKPRKGKVGGALPDALVEYQERLIEYREQNPHIPYRQSQQNVKNGY